MTVGITATGVTAAHPAAAISGGAAVPVSSYPFMVRLRHYENKMNYQCGGALISSTWIATAAHCFFRNDGSRFSGTWVAAVGAEAYDWTTKNQAVKQIIVHPNYPVGEIYPFVNGAPRTQDWHDDFALVQLSQPAKQGTPVALARSEPQPGSVVREVGWAGINWGDPGNLRMRDIGVLSDTTCGLTGQLAVTQSTYWCAGITSAGGDVMQFGDSGGPVVAKAPNGSWLFAGDISRGSLTYYDWLTSVPSQLTFIKDKTGLTGSVDPVAPDRRAIPSYDNMRPGAPHNGYFLSAWQPFTAKSNMVSWISATVGTGGYAAGVLVPGRNLLLRICNNPNCSTIYAQASPQVVNYGETGVDLGAARLSKGMTYYLVWYQPPAINGRTWVTYWWGGGSSISTSDQMQARVQGFEG
jgi:hypothetical protein